MANEQQEQPLQQPENQTNLTGAELNSALMRKLQREFGRLPANQEELDQMLDQLQFSAQRDAEQTIRARRNRDEDNHRETRYYRTPIEVKLTKDTAAADLGELVKGYGLSGVYQDILNRGLSDKDLKDVTQETIDRNPAFAAQMVNRFANEVEAARTEAREKNDLEALSKLDELLRNVNQFARTINSGVSSNEVGSVQFSLTGTEIQKISESLASAREIMGSWVSEIESRDKMAHQDVNQGLFSKFWTAVAWFATLDYPREGPAEVVRQKKNDLVNEFRARLELHNMKQAMSSNDEQTILHESVNIGSATIFEGFNVAKAETAFNLYQRLFERFRFRFGDVTEVWDDKQRKFVKRVEKIENNPNRFKIFDDNRKDYIEVSEAEKDDYVREHRGTSLDRITQLDLNTIQREAEEELTSNYLLYGFKDAKEAFTAAKVGFNVFRASMRMAVHVSKGRVQRPEVINNDKSYRELRKEAAFESDPDEVLVNQYNPWQFSIEKWSRMGQAQYKIFEKIMKLMGEGNLDLGHQKMINILNIPDYFSSGWRIETLFDGLERRLMVSEILKEKNNALTDEEKKLSRKDRVKRRIDTIATGLKFKWKKSDESAAMVAKFRPMEFIKAYALDYDEYGREYEVSNRHGEFKKSLRDGGFDIGNLKIRDYYKLEKILGRYIYPIYEKAANPQEHGHFDWTKLEGIDIANPTNEDHKKIIKSVVDLINRSGQVPEDERLSEEQVVGLYRKVQEFASDKATIKDVVGNTKLDQLHHKTLYLDDAPLGAMEHGMENPEGNYIPKISKQFFEIEGGRRDPYARMWGDTFTAGQAQNHMWNAMNARDQGKLTEELSGVAGSLVSYAGRGPYMYLSANLAAGWLDMAKADLVWGTLSANNKVPWATSEFERLFGLAAPSMSRDEIKGVWERLKLAFGQYELEDEFGKTTNKDLDARMTKELGLESWKLSITTLKSIALIALVAMMQAILKEQEGIDDA